MMAAILAALALTVPMAHANAASASGVIEPGRVIERRVQIGQERARYFLYVPQKVGPERRLFVTVHGISRNAREHARLFAPIAESYGVIVLAPLFTEKTFQDYQRLGMGAEDRRADRVLDVMMEDAGRLTGATTGKFWLFGYSGGGQFAHRYVMAHPGRVTAYAVGAAGWYTFPDRRATFPVGLRTREALPDLRLRPSRFLTVPATVFVGDRDTRKDSALRQRRDINRMQGESRFERGRRWVVAMEEAAHRKGLDGSFEFVSLPGCGHSFRHCMNRGRMGDAVFERLFGASPAKILSQEKVA